MQKTFKRTKGKSAGMEITVNVVDGLDELAESRGWEEVKPKAKPGPKPKAKSEEPDITE